MLRNVAIYMFPSGIFPGVRKYACVKDLTNIMSDEDEQKHYHDDDDVMMMMMRMIKMMMRLHLRFPQTIHKAG